MKFVQHAQAQLSNGQNISIEHEPGVLILNKSLRIPLKEVKALTAVLLSYVPRGTRQRRVIKSRKQEVSRDAMLQWVGPSVKTMAKEFPEEGTKIRRIAEAISRLTAGPIRRKELHDKLCEELKLSSSQVGTGTSALIHHFKFLRVVSR